MHYQNKKTYSHIKEVNELNELRIRQAKEEHEKELINPQHEQCQILPASIDNTSHGIHIDPCYKLFTRVLAGKGSEENVNQQSRPSRRSSSSKSGTWFFPKECYLCNKYRVQFKGKKVIPVMIERDEAEDTIKAAAKAKNPNLYFEIKDVDLFVKEFETHVHCYCGFTHGFNKTSRASVNDQNQSDNVSTFSI